MKKFSIIALVVCCTLLTACGKINVSYEVPKWIDSIKQQIGLGKSDDISLEVPTEPVTEPAIEAPTEAPTETYTEAPTEADATEPAYESYETIPYEPYTDWRGVYYEIVEPYPIPIVNPDKDIYDSPDGNYVGDFGNIAYYTIVEQAEDTNGYTWGKLSTGEGWTLVYHQILPDMTMVCNNGSSISIRGNGFFDGSYSNYEMSNTGSGYPNGTTYVCDFDGKFNVTDIGKYSVTLKLASLETDQTSGKSWTSGGIKYIASKPYGLENCKYFILYIPGTTDNMLPEDITNLNRGIRNGILNCYVLYNPSTGAAFFSY